VKQGFDGGRRHRPRSLADRKKQNALLARNAERIDRASGCGARIGAGYCRVVK
jgi:hypothetical protein